MSVLVVIILHFGESM